MHGSGIKPGVPAKNEIKYLQRAQIFVSYHIYITKTGDVHQMIPDLQFRGWHAGSSGWGGDSDLNDLSVGIGLESTNSFAEVYPAPQWDAAMELVRSLMGELGVVPSNILTHREISIPKGRKIDPVAFPIDQFRMNAASRQIPIPLYGERNENLGSVTVVDGRKAYLSDANHALICSDDQG
jgi:N-acetyl-anhydromuramyl-L-alanine amidase AmpD